jgi:hypothetical protein
MPDMPFNKVHNIIPDQAVASQRKRWYKAIFQGISSLTAKFCAD